MAENKTSFVLYSDQRTLIDLLTNEQAGILLKHIFAYVNDENPINTDQLINVVFEPIKQQFKRDLKKWEATKEGRSKAGLASAEARRIKQTSTNPTNVNFVQQDSTNINNTQQTSTNPTVNDNVNVTVNDNVIKDKKKPKTVSGNLQVSIIYPFDSENFKNKWSIWKEYKHKDHSFKYRSEISEGSALKKLNELSKQNENVAIQIIEQSISNGWAGFFELKNQNNGKSNTTLRTPEQEKAEFFAKRYGIDNGGNQNNESEYTEIIDTSNVPRKRFGS